MFLPLCVLAAFVSLFIVRLPPASAQATPELKRRLTLELIASDQGRLTALPGTQCAGDLRTGVDLVGTLTSGGLERTYRLHMPETVKRGEPAPLVLNFHALAANGAIQEELSGLRAISDREGFILVSPDAYGTPSGWNALLNGNSGVDDVQFVADLLARLSQDYCIDVRRIYATGFSSGGMLASRLGCELGTRFAAVAPVAGVYAPDDLCVGVSPMLAIHGTRDTVVPFSGGTAVGVPYPGARAAVAQWAGRIARCFGGVVSTSIAPGVTLEEYTGCGSQYTALLVVEGLGHAPPSGADAEYIWSFFKRFKLGYGPSY
jgi:polyhydroxybutyrate depolymerase